MKRFRVLLLLIVLFSALSSKAMGPFDQSISHLKPLVLKLEIPQPDIQIFKYDGVVKSPNLRLALITRLLNKRKENPRWVAVGLCIALGPFGVHRMYLGTDAKVPILYALTLGGGLGVLPLIDLFQLLFTKDISRFYNNPNVFMWVGLDE